MKKITSISSHRWDFMEMAEKKALQNKIIKSNNDFYRFAESILNNYDLLIKSNDNVITKIEKTLDLMDMLNDLITATNVKYRLNITTSKTGINFYQLKGAIGYEGKKKLWVCMSLGNEKNVTENYGTTDADKLKDLLHNEIIWKTFYSFQQLRKG
jgi:hypothetical protein